MSTASTIVVFEQTARGEHIRALTRDTNNIRVIRPDGDGQRLLLGEALARLERIRARRERFDAAVLSCDGRTDWASGYARARIARVLLTLLEPGSGRLTLQTPFASPALETQIRQLADALTSVAAGETIATKFGVPRDERPGIAFSRARVDRAMAASIA